MFLVKVECKNLEVEKLASYLSEIVEPFFRVWLFEKKVYAIFKVNSLSTLKTLINKLKRDKHLEFRIFRIEEV